MINITITRLRLKNFKCHRLWELSLEGRSASVYGDNATGWLLLGKDSAGRGEKNIAIEANYGGEILARSERIPDKVRHRITNSHMEIDALCRYLRELDLTDCREIYLLHLSDAMSNEGQFVHKISEQISPKISVIVCKK